jgi:hypothetical protein
VGLHVYQTVEELNNTGGLRFEDKANILANGLAQILLDREPISMSWRYAGGVVSHLARKGGCYLDYYCSGNEGVVSPHIRDALDALGWISAPWPEDEG